MRGRVSHTEKGPESLRKAAQGQYVLRMNLVTAAGEVVTLNVQEGLTKVFEGAQLTGAGAVRANARIKATVDDDCALAVRPTSAAPAPPRTSTSGRGT